MAVSTDVEHKFELAIQLEDLGKAHLLAKESSSPQKWRQLSELATAQADLELAQECLHQAQDYGGLLLLATSSGIYLYILYLYSIGIYILFYFSR